MSSDICIVSVETETTNLFRQAVSTLPKPPLVIETTLDSAESAVRAAMAGGCEIFLAMEHNARNLRKKFGSTVVSISLNDLDIAEALYRAKKQYGQPVAMMRYRFQNEKLLSSLREVLDCEIRDFIFHNEEDCRAMLLKAGQEGCRAAVVGGPILIFSTREQTIPYVPLLPTQANIILAVQQAEQMAQVRQVERREAMKFKYVAQHSFTGIIVTDEQQRIIVFNPAAERIFGIEERKALGSYLAKVIPQGHLLTEGPMDQTQLEDLKVLRQKNKIQNKQLIVNRIPIVEEERVQGLIFTFQEVSDIQSMEEKIRRASHAKGLFAKLGFQNIVGNSKTLREAVNRARRFAGTDETILITGESGTGKEVFAQSIHNASHRHGHPFLAINCSAISPSLLESELFGYAEGSFTGARRGGKQGVFELAHLGTIFLDEIGELSREAQGHLLRVLQEKEVMRLGDAKITPVNVRVIAATNRPFENALQQNLFRWDLYHRLNVLQLRLPPLREHPEDILPLADHFITQWCAQRRLAQKIKEALARYEDLLTLYGWPGNVRELQNLLRRVVALIGTMTGDSVDQEIRELLEENFGNTPPLVSAAKRSPGMPKFTIADQNTELIRRQHDEWRGSKAELARRLGIGRTTLWRRLKEAGPG
jgi:propionate catabolism operon transcriptional regulator